jgi:hypothetical protein
MPEDRWGIPFFYASSLRNPFFYQQSDDPESDDNLGGKDDINFGSGEEFSIHINGPTSFYVLRDPSFNDSIGGCNMSFADSESRGYTNKPNDLRDVEYKCLIKITGGDGQNTLSISGPTGHHTSSNCCQGFSYMFNISYTDSTPIMRFRKEMWHVSYHSLPEFTDPRLTFKLSGHGYVGLGYVRYNKKDGRGTGKDSVILEGWFNPDPVANIKNWFMVRRYEDKGGWGNDGDDCDGAADQVGTWGGEHFRIKSNDSSADFTVKHLSLREIDPSLDFDDTPTEPPPTGGGGGGGTPTETTTVQGVFKIQNDINTYRTSACAGTGTGGGAPGGTGNTIFYSVDAFNDKELSNTTAFDKRTRIAMRADNSSSVFKGKLPIQVDIPLKKVGSPTAGLVHMKIYSSSGSQVYDSPTTINPSTLTTSYVKKTFDFSTNTHVLTTGDWIGVQYTTSSDSDYVVAGYAGNATANTTYGQFEDGTWDVKTRSLAMDVWE